MTGDLLALPKAHLHVHLENTVRESTLAELADAHGIPVPTIDPGESAVVVSSGGAVAGSGRGAWSGAGAVQVVAGRSGPGRAGAGATRAAVFSGFAAFAVHNAAVRDCLRRAVDFERVAYEFCVDSAADGVRYAELTFTAGAHGARLGTPELPLEAVVSGIRAGMRDAPIEVRLLLDHSRRRPLDWARSTVDLAVRHPEVVGFGVAGDEAAALAPYAELVAEAADAGLHLVHHAGETAGPASVREAIDVGRAERIGHGFRSLEDPTVVADLRDRRIPLEVCPSSNVALGLVPSADEHPLPALLAAGLVVTLNADVPSVTGRPLSAEYAAARDTFGLDDDQLAALARSGVDASFATAGTKRRLHADIDAWLTP